MIRVVINSHKNSTTALNILLNSLKECPEFHTFEILVCVGGFYDIADYIVTTDGNIKYIRCNHNSIDYTGLITIMDLFLDNNDTYLYLHDTCKVGPLFFKNVSKLKLHEPMRLCNSCPSMNIGVYTAETIRANQAFLKSRKNLSEDKSQTFKIQAVLLEDHIFNNSRVSNSMCRYPAVFPPKDIYGTGVLRITEYYDCLDLYKYKANWAQKSSYELNN